MKRTRVHPRRALLFIAYTIALGVLAVLMGGRFGDTYFNTICGIGAIVWILLLLNWVIIR